MLSRKPKARFRLGKKRRTVKPGTVPGELTVDLEAPHPTIHAMAWSSDAEFMETQVEKTEEISALRAHYSFVWIDVAGLGNLAIVEEVGAMFSLHRLALEDVLNVNQRPKVEYFSDHLFLTMRLLTVAAELEAEQISLFLGKNFVLTFQERLGDCFDGVRERLRRGKGRIRNSGADYVAYALIDSVVDHSFPLLEHFGELLESLEEEVLERPDRETIRHVFAVKTELIAIRRAVWPQRELLNSLMRDAPPLVSQDNVVYLRDCYDHTAQIIDLVENFRDIAASLVDVYLSTVSNRMNDVMRVLTIIATIFIPLGFLAGIYGMNFDSSVSKWNMPELRSPFGYPLLIGFMVTCAGGMLFYFYRKGWIGSKY
ncbi:MAG: magnesium/cobalt transporter CorA [Candidatus Lernaella stagnicola]|nr:magnesium/cobalt transporter CorA [Candidatus Lernaella stagnicola]